MHHSMPEDIMLELSGSMQKPAAALCNNMQMSAYICPLVLCLVDAFTAETLLSDVNRHFLSTKFDCMHAL